MSQEEVEIVRRLAAFGHDAVRKGNLAQRLDEAATAGLISRTCEWRGGPGKDGAVVGVGDVVGLEGIVDFILTWTEDFSEFTFEVEDVLEADQDRVVLIQRQTGIGKASGAPVSVRTAYVLTLDSWSTRVRSGIRAWS